MKHLIVAALMLLSANVFALETTTIKTFTNPALTKAAHNIADQIFVSNYAFKKVSAQENKQNLILNTFKTLCDSFDKTVTTQLLTKSATTADLVAKEFANNIVSERNDGYDTYLAAVKTALSLDDVEIYQGLASNYNMPGTLLGFYDVKNNELAVFSNTTCGYDN